MPQELNLSRVYRSLKTKSLGRIIFFAQEVDSTNEWAKKLARSGAKEGTVTIAAIQTSGRGRLTRKWVSPRGGLWLSIILRPKMRPHDVFMLTFLAALSAAETLKRLYGLEVETKWPNDVLVGDRKICGVIGETNSEDETVNFVIVGIGINANFDSDNVLPNSIAATATSVETELRRKIQLENLLIALLERLEVRYEELTESGFAHILAEWKTYARFLGQQVEVADDDRSILGIAENVDEEGGLVITFGDGTSKRILTGDLSTRTRVKRF